MTAARRRPAAASSLGLAACALALLLSAAPRAAFAVGADACGTGGWCPCPGGASAGRCLGSYATCEEACGLTGSSGGSGGGMTPQQQLGMQMGMLGAQMLGQGLHQALYGDPAQKAREEAARAAQEAEQRRIKEENDRRFNEEKSRVLQRMSGGSDTLTFKDDDPPAGESASSIAPAAGEKPPKPLDPRFKSPLFSKGYDAASRCGSQNAGLACADAPGDKLDDCLNDYRAGFEVGRKQQEAALEQATKKGEEAATRGLQNNAASDADSGGDCRTQWVEAYNRGYFQSAHSTTRKK